MADTHTTHDVVIKCAGLTKVFKDFWFRNRVVAVDKVDLDVRRGEVFGLLGPNGSGKSTTIKMILGLLHPTDGRIAVFGHHPREVAIKQNIGYLPEESYLYRFLNARETLEYYGRLFHQNAEQRRHRIDQLLKWVGLEHVARRPVGEFSKGMQRRIGLAQALINDPQLLILDEPTSGLDPIGTRQIKDLIQELARRGKTVLLSSHLLGDVEDVCDRVAIMFGGKIRKHGTVDELLVREELTNIQTQSLSQEEIDELEAVLARRGHAIERVERPRQRLEQLFLDIVHQAQHEGVAFSGARSGGRLAGFLTEGEDDPAGDLIHQLTQPAAPPPPEEKQGAPAVSDDEQIDANIEKIDELMAEMGVQAAPPAPEPDKRTTIERELSASPPEEVVSSTDVELPDWARAPRSESERRRADAPADGPDRSVLDSLLGDEKNKG